MSTLKRIKGMLWQPTAEWDAVAQDMPGAGMMLRGYLLPLALLAPLATVVGMTVFDTGWSPNYGYSLLRDRAPIIAIATYGFEIASVYLLAAVFYLLARTEKRSPSFLVALQVAVFGSIPLLLSGAMLVIPFNVIFTMIAAMYSFYLYHLGISRLFGIRSADATMFVGVTAIFMMVLSGFMGALASALGVY